MSAETQPTVRHCVLGCFADDATDEQKAAMMEGLRGLPAKIPQIHSLLVGMDLGMVKGNHDWALNVEFASKEDYEVYAGHEAHVEVISTLIKPILKAGTRTAVQFALS